VTGPTVIRGADRKRTWCARLCSPASHSATARGPDPHPRAGSGRVQVVPRGAHAGFRLRRPWQRGYHARGRASVSAKSTPRSFSCRPLMARRLGNPVVTCAGRAASAARPGRRSCRVLPDGGELRCPKTLPGRAGRGGSALRCAPGPARASSASWPMNGMVLRPGSASIGHAVRASAPSPPGREIGDAGVPDAPAS
jgi:hypothetical protein